MHLRFIAWASANLTETDQQEKNKFINTCIVHIHTRVSRGNSKCWFKLRAYLASEQRTVSL